ncbi:glycosyltransferase family 4 protein [Sphingomonas crocodyli]|uniref:Glycosyltransferase n=1 Tax=Sphingomonas crocodyli TaxID=1979270 RepID=A0A437LYS2_9SPHN|nr:glycosyltransferase family 4 protein [Sphingomonas crocodyli]RVT90532.1 glycosyltransferase [Sphingomonas crocodyli]
MCGIATFTADIRSALIAQRPELQADVYAMDEPGGLHAYPPEVVCQVGQSDLADYRAAARRINDSGAEIILIQHEYGIFGGPAGAHLLQLLDRTHKPVVVTLHTVLDNPSPDQRTVIEGLARRASKLVVMAEKGRRFLEDVHGIASSKIVVIPHGVPDRPLADIETAKRRFGYDGHHVLLTFGLLSPNKGIETIIQALPAIVAEHPNTLYIVLGATHPTLVARDGEAYRESLSALAAELGVAAHIRFVNEYTETERLLDYLEAVDIYVTPYLNEAQITSGTLSYAVALGKPVVSAPFWHAVEILTSELGALVPFGDHVGFARELSALLSDDDRREAARHNAYALGRTMIWQRLAEAYLAIFDDVAWDGAVRLPMAYRQVEAAPCLDAIEQLSDHCGMMQHSIFSVPDRNHGYCVDDNARALILMHRLGNARGDRSEALAIIYASFVQHAWNSARGAFRNFMSYDRRWLEEVGSEDSFGRSLWSVGVTAHEAQRQDLRRWAIHLFDQVAPHALALRSIRACAFTMLGATSVLKVTPSHAVARLIMEKFGERLHAELLAYRRDDWRWFEPVLGYDNARLPEALMIAGDILEREAMVADGLDALTWLDLLQTAPSGYYRAIGTESFGRRFAAPLPYDQQPLEAWASIDAALTAAAISGDSGWNDAAMRAWRWYLGDNDLGLPMASMNAGACFDGLMSDRANLNTGAESVLAFQFACCAIARLQAEEIVEPSQTEAVAV